MPLNLRCLAYRGAAPTALRSAREAPACNASGPSFFLLSGGQQAALRKAGPSRGFAGLGVRRPWRVSSQESRLRGTVVPHGTCSLRCARTSPYTLTRMRGPAKSLRSSLRPASGGDASILASLESRLWSACGAIKPYPLRFAFPPTIGGSSAVSTKHNRALSSEVAPVPASRSQTRRPNRPPPTHHLVVG